MLLSVAVFILLNIRLYVMSTVYYTILCHTFQTATLLILICKNWGIMQIRTNRGRENKFFIIPQVYASFNGETDLRCSDARKNQSINQLMEKPRGCMFKILVPVVTHQLGPNSSVMVIIAACSDHQNTSVTSPGLSLVVILRTGLDQPSILS